MDDPKVPTQPSSLRWRIWWRFGFLPMVRFAYLLPMAEWRRESWIQRVDFWAMDHLR